MTDIHPDAAEQHVMKRIVEICPPFRAVVALVIFAAGCLQSHSLRAADKGALPAVGDDALDFELESLAGKTVKLSELVKEGPVVLVALRGYPGYQCPLCTAQVGKFLSSEKKFRNAGATVVMVYPGPADGLKKHAGEFA